MIEETERVRLLVSNIRLQCRTKINILETGTFSETIFKGDVWLRLWNPGRWYKRDLTRQGRLRGVFWGWEYHIFVSFLCWPRSCSTKSISQFLHNDGRRTPPLAAGQQLHHPLHRGRHASRSCGLPQVEQVEKHMRKRLWFIWNHHHPLHLGSGQLWPGF